MNGAALHPILRNRHGAKAMPPRRIDALVGWFGAILAILCALAAALGVYWLAPPGGVCRPSPRGGPATTSSVNVRVADTDLVAPTAWLRSRVVGPVERLD